MLRMIHVRYLNSKEGFVDDVTLNELILSKRIKHFYRPSENQWVDIEVGPLRTMVVKHSGHEQRWSESEGDETREGGKERPRDFFSKFRKHQRSSAPSTPPKPTANDYYEQGYRLSYSAHEYDKAARVFAQCIQNDSHHTKAYLHRGMSYERLGNLQQAIEDYSRAIELSPRNAENYYIRGFAYLRLGMDREAKEDIITAAGMGYRLAKDYIRLKGKSWKS